MSFFSFKSWLRRWPKCQYLQVICFFCTMKDNKQTMILQFELQYSKCSFPHKLEVRPSHNDQFCSTWGNYHFKTFDGDFFQLPFNCNYILASQCKSSYENFNIQLQRQEINGVITIKKVTMRLEGIVVELANTSIKVDDEAWVCFDNATFHYQLMYWSQWWLM